VNNLGSLADLRKIETQGFDKYKNEREKIMLY